MFESFAKKHGEAFLEANSLSEAEHKLEFTDIFAEYKRQFEEIFEKAVEDVGGDLDAFYEECKEELHRGGGNSFVVEMLISASEYSRFYGLMRNEVRRLQLSGEL